MYFELDEYKTRVATTREQMARDNLDLLLLFGQEATCWLSGFYTHGHFAYIALGLPREGEPFLVLRKMEEQAADATTWVEKRYIYHDHQDPIEFTRQAVVEAGLGSARIGIDKHSWYLTLERFEQLSAALPNAKFLGENRMMEKLRIIKTPAELALLRVAGHAVDTAMEAAICATKPGAGEREIASAMASARIMAGSDLPIDGVLTTGARTLQGHGPWTDKRIEGGEPFYYEFHGIRSHYWARSLRSGVLGNASPRQVMLSKLLIDAQDAAINLMKPGVDARTVDTACREPIVAAGVQDRETYRRRIGYCLGLNFRPTPGEMILEFKPDADFKLAPGMVFLMLVMAEGVGIGDTVVVTETGVEYLTKLPRVFFDDAERERLIATAATK
ncbi:Xaa-Pro peptidase family protein [Caballeronia sp. AZ7_KS35]|uniref:M24 family metallopeptidase n=1 Tax=Caballeronia sp. AZ7_KS35 TaxID=2921762 RepID=UPI0020282224|nr:Xaa-Pro peptidase family protein [Caballeronia sp. AZ7_KS35]